MPRSALGRRAAARVTAAVSAAVVLPLALPASPAAAATAADWERLASCESGGNWHINTGNGYYGGLQFSSSTWLGFGGGGYAPRADLASPAQQMDIANRVLAVQGWNAWPSCSRRVGLYGTPTTPPAPPPPPRSAIGQRYDAEPGLRALLGAPVGGERAAGPVSYQIYQGGELHASAGTGVRELHGHNLIRFVALGGHGFGVPVTDELGSPDGAGRYNHFTGDRSIYWTITTGSHAVQGAIRTAWAGSGWELGRLGYPVTSENTAPDGVGRFNHFSRGGSIYWTPRTGAHAVHGQIRARWAALGWERSFLGYPTSEEFRVPVGRRANFQGGHLIWNSRTGAVSVHRR